MEELVRVGYGRMDITPEDSVPMGGYGNPSVRYNEVVRDPLYATCIAFTDAEDNTVLQFTTDCTSISVALANKVRDVLCPEMGLKPEQIMIAATHTHSAPFVTAEDVPSIAAFREKYVTNMCEAARQAMADRLPSLIYVSGVPTERMNFIRHYKMADGTYAGSNFGKWGSGIVGHASNNDSWVQVIKFDRIGGKSIILMNWQAHPCFTGGIDKKVLSADYIGDLRKFVELKTGARFAFFQGAAGNHNGVSVKKSEMLYTECEEYGKALGEYVLRALEAPVPVKGGKVRLVKRTLELELDHSDDHMVEKAKEIREEWTRTYDRSACNKRAQKELGLNSIYAVSAVIGRSERGTSENLDIHAFCVGDLGFACAPYEMFGSSGMYIKEYSPCAMTFVVSCCNGAYSYLASDLAFSHGCYEVDIRRYPRGTAEKLAENFVDMLKEMQ